MKTPFFLFFSSALALFSDPIQDQLQSLQELRTLIPERVWFQEFSILVDRAGYECQAKQRIESLEKGDPSQRPLFAIAGSQDYLQFSTLSGENVRIMDRYQQFEQSPFWRTPEMVRRLETLENSR